MEPKKIALLVGALIVAAVTAFMAKSMFGQAAAPQAVAAAAPEQPAGPEVLVATRALPVGTIIDAQAFKYQPWPKDLVENVYFLKGAAEPASLAGTVVRTAITAGQPLTQGALVKKGERGFLAAALGPGMRAVTFPVSEKAGVAGFVFPGDRVDLMLSQNLEGEGPPLRAAETIVRNLRVLATDQRTVTHDENGNQVVKVYSAVTVEATPRIAEKIVVAQQIGTLSLALRAIADNTAELERAIAAGEVTVPEGDDPRAEKRMLLAVQSRPIDTGLSHVTGADVSRYQRRTVPKTPVPIGPNGVPVAAPEGPTVKVARGNNVTVVPVGGK